MIANPTSASTAMLPSTMPVHLRTVRISDLLLDIYCCALYEVCRTADGVTTTGGVNQGVNIGKFVRWRQPRAHRRERPGGLDAAGPGRGISRGAGRAVSGSGNHEQTLRA